MQSTTNVNEYKQLPDNHEEMNVNKQADFYAKDFAVSVSRRHFNEYIFE